MTNQLQKKVTEQKQYLQELRSMETTTREARICRNNKIDREQKHLDDLIGRMVIKETFVATSSLSKIN